MRLTSTSPRCRGILDVAALSGWPSYSIKREGYRFSRLRTYSWKSPHFGKIGTCATGVPDSFCKADMNWGPGGYPTPAQPPNLSGLVEAVSVPGTSRLWSCGAQPVKRPLFFASAVANMAEYRFIHSQPKVPTREELSHVIRKNSSTQASQDTLLAGEAASS